MFKRAYRPFQFCVIFVLNLSGSKVMNQKVVGCPSMTPLTLPSSYNRDILLSLFQETMSSLLIWTKRRELQEEDVISAPAALTLVIYLK